MSAMMSLRFIGQRNDNELMTQKNTFGLNESVDI